MKGARPGPRHKVGRKAPSTPRQGAGHVPPAVKPRSPVVAGKPAAGARRPAAVGASAAGDKTRVPAAGAAEPRSSASQKTARPSVPPALPDNVQGVRRNVELARDRRRAAGLPSDATNVYRLINDAGDGLPGLQVDVWGACAVVRLRSDGWMDAAPRLLLRDLLLEMGLQSIHYIIDAPSKDRSRPDTDAATRMNDAMVAAGLGAPDELECRENGVQYLIRPRDGYSQGLFTDMREVRHDLAQRWKGRRVLNLFAYTCGFGTALAGTHVTHVDVSSRYIDWGRRNLELNGRPESDATFVVDDVFHFMEEAIAEGRRWDAIICDPPAFSQGKTGKSRQFSIRRDLGTLVESVLACLEPTGEAMISTNLGNLAAASFARLMMGIATERGWTIGKTWTPQPDYPVATGEYHLKTALLVPMRTATPLR